MKEYGIVLYWDLEMRDQVQGLLNGETLTKSLPLSRTHFPDLKGKRVAGNDFGYFAHLYNAEILLIREHYVPSDLFIYDFVPRSFRR